MAIKLYLSQANQAHNAGPGGYTEKAGCAAIVRKLDAIFDGDERFRVKCAKVGDLVDTADENIAEANEWDADIYVAIHTNAGEKGTVTFHHSKSPKGKKLATAIYKALAPLSPGNEGGGRVRAMDGFKEIHGPRCPATLVELEAHDWKTGVAWITGERTAIAEALYVGICKGAGLNPKTSAKPKPKRIRLTKRSLTFARQYKPHRAGWYNLGFRPFYKKATGQGLGKRFKLTADEVTCPEPVTKPWWWDEAEAAAEKLAAEKKAAAEAAAAAAAAGKVVPRVRKRPPLFWRLKR